MTYSILADTLREFGDRAKAYFAQHGATGFVCEGEIGTDLALRPTWSATLRDGYRLCIEVGLTPLTPTIQAFVATCAARSLPIKLWVAIVGAPSGAEFMRDLRGAKELGIGVVQFPIDGGAPFELHQPVPFSLFGLRRCALGTIRHKYRDIIKRAEDAFMNGAPQDGCRQICEELEAVTRRFAYYSYKKKNWWRPRTNAPIRKESFFADGPWANVLQELDERIDEARVRSKKRHAFRKRLIAAARGHTNWRNSLSHKPKNPKQREERDEKLRSMFEVTRDLLIEWYEVAHEHKLKL